MSRTDKDRPLKLQFDDPMATSRLAIAPWHEHRRYDFRTDSYFPMECDFGQRNNIDDFKRKHDGGPCRNPPVVGVPRVSRERDPGVFPF